MLKKLKNEGEFRKFLQFYAKKDERITYFGRIESSVNTGLPDIIIMTANNIFLLELKYENRELSLKQEFIFNLSNNNFILRYFFKNGKHAIEVSSNFADKKMIYSATDLFNFILEGGD